LHHSTPTRANTTDIFPQQVTLLYSGALEGLIATAVNAPVLAYIQRDVIPTQVIGWWLFYMAAVTLTRAGSVYRYWASPDSDTRALHWSHVYGIGAALAGLGWGMAGIVLYPSGSISHQVFLVFMLGGMAAGAVAVLTPRFEVFLLFFLPTLLPVIVQLFRQQDERHFAMGAVLLIFMSALLFTARRMYRTIGASLTLRTENTDLVQYLRSANVQAEQLNRELKTEIQQREEIETALRESQEQLLQSQKMEAMGQLAGGIAHDFNNLLLVINGYSELLLNDPTFDEKKRRDLEQIKQAGNRAAALTHKMLAFSRRQLCQPRPIDLNTVVSNISPMLSRLIGETIHVMVTSTPVGRVKADPMQLEQVIVNLAVNARDAMPDGGTLTIETSNVELDHIYTDQHQGSHIGTYVRLTVRDTGMGMDAETKRRVFEPFFTTKEIGKGTGLGLSMVYGIIKQSGGYIDVTSEPGSGSTFTIYLPRLSSTVTLSRPALVVRPLPMGRERILLVEDEPAVRGFISNLLRRQGYDVYEASDGDDALRIEQTLEAIHLLVTDLVMPRLGGFELAQRLAEQRPELKVLYVSGYTDDLLLQREGLPAGTDLLRKPFTPEALSCKVREVLDRSSTHRE
jgi:signal transduction histidine kinase